MSIKGEHCAVYVWSSLQQTRATGGRIIHLCSQSEWDIYFQDLFIDQFIKPGHQEKPRPSCETRGTLLKCLPKNLRLVSKADFLSGNKRYRSFRRVYYPIKAPHPMT